MGDETLSSKKEKVEEMMDCLFEICVYLKTSLVSEDELYIYHY